MDGALTAKARLLRSYHEPGRVLVLPNAWDAGSAVVLARAGARAIATTSAGVSWAHGKSDGERLTRSEMLAAVRRIATAVDLPVTADVEGGYGPTPDDAARTAAGVIEAGGVGVLMEDSPGDGAPLRSAHAQAKRIAAARQAAIDAGLPDLFLNARTDVYMLSVGDPARRLDDVLARAAVYAQAGADCLFVPLLLDLAALTKLVAASPLPVNAMAVPGGPTVAQFAEAGVRRVSVGTIIAQVAYSAAEGAARELLEAGTYTAAAQARSFMELNSWMP